MKFNVLTIFPKMIDSYAGESILKRGQKANAINVQAVDIRKFSQNKHNTVDDTPYGGGAGMVMQVEPIFHALKSIDAIPFAKANGLSKLKKIVTGKISKKKRTVLLSPRGRVFDQRTAEKWAKLDELTLICGRYEGIDHRVTDRLIDEEISVGPYVLAGGELGALAIVEAVSRLVPGVLGNPESIVEETHAKNIDAEYPQYSKPADFKGWKVPDVLLSGDHKKIKDWRKSQSKKEKN
jgi:tRNA (guanine37-N1)-methyltransferase